MSKTVNRAELLKRLSPAQRALLLKELQKEAAQNGSHDIPRHAEPGPVPLSFSQQRLWFVSQIDPDTPLYNVPEAIELKGQLNVAALEQSLNEIIRRHEALRTSFTIVDRQPVQISAPSRRLSLKLVDLTKLPASAREACARRLLETEARRPFDLTNDLLLRATLLQLEAEHYWAILTLHHIVADGWSMGILIRETAALYQVFAEGKISPLPELPIQYTDFTQWQREWLQGERLAAQLDYWKQQLAGAPPLQLPADRPRAVRANLEGARLEFTLLPTLSKAVKRLSESEGATLFMTLLAAFEVLLYRYTQQDDIVVGTAIANRHHGETENLIGFFLNVLVLRAKLSGKLTFHEVLQRVREVALGAYEHQDLPFDRLVEELQPERQLNRNPLFQVVFAVHSGLAPTLELRGLNVRQLPATSKTSKYDLSLEFVDTGEALTGFLEYSTELFEQETIQRLLAHYQTLLESIVKNPTQCVAWLQLLPQHERRQLLDLNNDRAYPIESCLHELVTAQVERTPHAIALTFENQLITYRELDDRANQLAHYLRRLGVGPDVLVSIFMERSVEMLVGLLGVLKAGGAYVPIDPAYPAERVAFILEDTAAPVLLTQQPLLPALPPHSARVVCLDEKHEDIEQASVDALLNNVSPDNLAYIIYTSGSTGKPKGVMVTHRNVTRLFAATQNFAFNEHDVWTLFHSYAFDFSVWEMWGALLYGGRLVIVPYWASRSPDAFDEMLVRERVTVLNQTPSAFRQLCQIDEKSEVQQSLALRLVIFGGEALDFESLGQWFRDHGDEQPQLVNMYGITETTVHVTQRRVRAADLAANTGSLIGRPISDLREYVLDQDMELLPQGVPGELYVGGGGVARGYLWRPELTGERFVPDPFSSQQGSRLYRTGDLVRYRAEGELEYLGRVDQQVKIRGFRIEPGEIESALEQHAEVREAVVIASEDVPGEPRLIAYIVPEPNHDEHNEAIDSAELSAEQVAQWEMVFNENYSQGSSQSDPTFNITGWNNSYTGTPIAAEEMRDWVDQTVNRILALQPQNVLEIGCGTGLLLFRIAPHCTRYVATDFSPIALDYIQQTLSLSNEDLPQLELLQRRADNLDGIEHGAFDLVILNSVVQYFPTIDYLLRVIEGAVRLVKPGGSIFIGDVRSLPLLEAFHLAVQLHQAPASLPVAQLEQRVKRHMAQEEELIVEPAFFAALRQQFSQIGDVEVMLKRGRYQNEMTQFRYDVILRLGVEPAADEAATLDWPNERLSLNALPELLNRMEADSVTLTNVPNARVFLPVKAIELLRSEKRPQTAGELREALEQIGSGETIDPEEVAGLGCDLWTSTNAGGCFDIVWRRWKDNHDLIGGEEFSRKGTKAQRKTQRKPIDLKPWEKYANKPLEGRFARRLVPKLRAFLQEQLPDYMVPSAFVLMDSMPLTQHGKINRRALPAPEQSRPELEDIYVAPRTQTEKKLAAMFAHVLGVTQVGLHDNFFELGGHSLLATQLLSRIRETFADKEITLRQIFESPTVAGLAYDIESSSTSDQNLPPLIPIPRENGLPLSFAQQRLWFLDQLEPDSAVYNCPASVRFRGALNIAALEQSFNEVVRRHEVLRTSFASRDGYPLQVIASSLHVPLPLIDLSNLPPERLEAEIQRLSVLEAQRAFDLSNGALLRTKLLRVSAAEHVVLLTMHHIISDGWSIGVLVKEVAALYSTYARGDASTLEPLPVQYADYAYWEREWLQGEVLEEQLEYWKQQLAGAVVLEVPVDRPRPQLQSYRGAYETFHLGKDLSRGLNELSRRLDATLFMTLLAAWQTLLHRYSGQHDIVVGSPIANRHRAETEALIGFFVNTLALRTDVSGNPTFAEVVQRVRETALGAYAHQALPFEKLIEELQPERDASHTPLMQVVFALQNAPQADLTALDLKLNYVEVQTGTAKFDLVIDMQEDDEGLSLSLRYSTDLFEAATIHRLARHFEALLGSIIEDAGKRISELNFLSDAEQRRLLVEPNATHTIYPADKCVHELFDEQVKDHAAAVALLCDGTEITYAELQRRSELLAGYLNERSVGRGSTVGIFLEHSIETIVSILGVLRAGAAYVPMDPEHPRARLAFIIEDARLQTILTKESLAERLPSREGVHVISVDGFDWKGTPIAAQHHSPISADPAYVIYTSGSTGQPKGVKISHRALVNYLSWCKDVYVKDEEVSFALYSSLAFDLTVTSLFTPLITGNRLVIYGRLDRFPVQSIVQDNLADVLKLTPSHLSLIKDLDNRNSRVKRLIVGGESLATDLAAEVHESFGGKAEILNEYGPTEATVGCMIYRFDPERDRRNAVPIGRPAANVQIYILDEHLNPTPENIAGELYIAGDGLAEGYINRPDLTAEKFIPHRFLFDARMYRSGDRARWLPNGEIEYLGRGDEQVKYHGYRIELSEIRSALNLHPQVRDSVVLLRKDHRGEDTLVAYYVSRRELETAALREFLLDHLIKETIPNVFIHLTRLPLTLNGKVDYEALPELKEIKERSGEYVAPRTVVEEVVADIWANLLGLPRVSLHDNFFELGGHSLIATQVMVRVRRTTGVELPLRALFESPTVAKLATQIEVELRSGAASSSPPIVPVARDEELPLSFAQQRLWFLDQLEPGTAVYNCPAAVRLNGPLNIAALEQSFNEVVRRHESLRTTFLTRDGHPLQVIAATLHVPLPIVDLSGLPAECMQAEVERLALLEAQVAFDLSRGPLLRTVLIRISEEEHVTLLNMHHIISDGWSISVFVSEVAALYNAYANGKPSALELPPVQYADYAHWEREWLKGEVLAEQLDYWKRELAGTAVLNLPTNKPRPQAQTYGGASEGINFDKELSSGLQQLSRRLEATLFMTLLAAWQTLLYRYSGQQDVVVGSPIANRHGAETEALIGFFVNTLAMRTDLSGNPSFSELVHRVRETALGAYAHQALPLEKLIEEIQPDRDPSHTPIMQVVFAWQNAPPADMNALNLKLSYMEIETGTAKFDLTLSLQETAEGMRGRLEYRRDLFEAATMKQLLVHFENLLRAVVAKPESRIAELPLLTENERRQVLEEWNNTATAYPREQSIHELFEEQVRTQPEALAAISNDSQLSYGELNQRANQLARVLQKRGVVPETLVGVSLPRSERLLIALLGILKAGGAYVFLDAGYPPERLALMVQDSAVRILVTEERLKERFSSVETICLDGEAELAAQPVDNLPTTFLGGQQLSYVSYTSGSTGTPKGVAVPHQGVVRLVKETNYASLDANSAFLQLAPISFDASTLELWGPLLNGGRCVLPREQILSAIELKDAIQRYEINSLWLTSSMFNAIVDEDVLALAELQQLLVGGEALSAPHIMRAVEQLTQTQIINGYGPTENTTFTCCFSIPKNLDPASATIPIGPPIANTQVYILDEEMQPVPIGVAGELYISGDGLARGYVSHPELTAERFVPNPFSRRGGEKLYRTGDLTRWRATGEIEFIGRRDRQVKLRGFRIELEEVEAALKRIPEVRDAKVGLNGKHPAGASLVAYVVADGLTEEQIRVSLQAQLPLYMVPGQVLLLERLPLNKHGKSDEEELRALAQSVDRSDEGATPTTDAEQTVAEVWGEVLGLERLGRNANFFGLGGHSLLATQAIARVRERFPVHIPLQWLFESPTVAEFALRIEAAASQNGEVRDNPIQPVARDGDLPLSFAQQRFWYLDRLRPGNPAYNSCALLRVTGPLNLPALEQVINYVVRRHEALRTTFAEVEGQPAQVIHPEQRITLLVANLIDLPRAGARIVQERLINAEAARSFDLSTGPLIRANVVRMSEREHLVSLTMHHIVTDGWSNDLFFKELVSLYSSYTEGRPSTLTTPAIQYVDFTHWEREQLNDTRLAAQRTYWQQQLADPPTPITLSERPLPPHSPRVARTHYFSLAGSTSDRLQQFTRDYNVTLYAALMAGFAALLHFYTGEDDLIIGTPVSNRNRKETEELIGCLINTLALRVRLEGKPSFAELARRVQNTILAGHAHQELPFEVMADSLASRTGKRAALFRHWFVLQRAVETLKADEARGLKWEIEEVGTAIAQFELTMMVRQMGAAVRCALVYAAGELAAEEVQPLAADYEAVLAAALEQPQASILELAWTERVVQQRVGQGMSI